MLLNYLKISLRNLRKNKISSAINITGLAVGMATCMLLFFWIDNELSYDRFHQNSDRIYRVERRWDFKEMHGQAPIAAAPWGPAMEKDYPEGLSLRSLYGRSLLLIGPGLRGRLGL